MYSACFSSFIYILMRLLNALLRKKKREAILFNFQQTPVGIVACPLVCAARSILHRSKGAVWFICFDAITCRNLSGNLLSSLQRPRNSGMHFHSSECVPFTRGLPAELSLPLCCIVSMHCLNSRRISAPLYMFSDFSWEKRIICFSMQNVVLRVLKVNLGCLEFEISCIVRYVCIQETSRHALVRKKKY